LKATLKIGDRQPTATGSFQPGIGGVGINPLVNTQFSFIDVGVNVEITPRVHENGDISLHIDLDISSVTGQVNLGGIDQPIIGQRKVSHDIRMPDGAVQLLAGLTKYQDTKTKTGIPGLGSIPVLGRLFTSESVDRERQELMIAIIPHVVRRPEYTAENLRGIAVGNQQSVHLNYGRQAGAPPSAGAPPAAGSMPPAGSVPPAATPAVVPKKEEPANPPMTAANQATAQPMGLPAGAPASTPPGLAPPATAPPMTAPPATAPAPEDAAKPAAPKQVGNAVVRFLQPQVETNPQGAITVSLIIENATDVASAPLQVSFDPKVLRLNDAGRGDFFSSDGQVPLFTKNIQNDAGAAAMNLNRLPNTAGVSGTGVLTTLSFQAVAKGSTTVTVPGLTVRNSQGQVVFSGSPQMTVNVK
jgi:general secretion pathway protein D